MWPARITFLFLLLLLFFFIFDLFIYLFILLDTSNWQYSLKKLQGINRDDEKVGDVFHFDFIAFPKISQPPS